MPSKIIDTTESADVVKRQERLQCNIHNDELIHVLQPAESTRPFIESPIASRAACICQSWCFDHQGCSIHSQVDPRLGYEA
jgi:hypothetical protein